MIVPVAIDLKLRQSTPYLQEVAGRVRPLISTYLESTGFAFISRIKQPASLAEKVETGRYSKWSEVDDLFACAIVIPTVADETAVLEFLRLSFREVVTRGRGSSLKDPSAFRFDSTRFVATLRPTLDPEPPDALSRQTFEVQVRTAFEHAWSVATHNLVYKGETIDWRRLRLMAQLKAATEQLDQLITGFDEVAEKILDQQWPEVSAKKLMEESFRQWIATGKIPEDASPDSWVRFSDNLYSLLRGTQGGRRNLKPELIEQALTAIKAAVDAQAGDRFPRSVSLLQFSLGALTAAGIASGELVDYRPLVTEPLKLLFPAVAELVAPFDIELAGV